LELAVSCVLRLRWNPTIITPHVHNAPERKTFQKVPSLARLPGTKDPAQVPGCVIQYPIRIVKYCFFVSIFSMFRMLKPLKWAISTLPISPLIDGNYLHDGTMYFLY